MRYHYKSQLNSRQRRHLRVRAKVEGSTERPRLNVFRSSAHIYAQVSTTRAGRPLPRRRPWSKDLPIASARERPRPTSEVVGSLIAERAKAAGIEQVVLRSRRVQVPWSGQGGGRRRT